MSSLRKRHRSVDVEWSKESLQFARLELKCGGDEFQGEEHSAVRRNGALNPAIRQLQNQNKKKRSQYEKLGYATEKARLLSVQPNQCWRGSMQTTAVLVVQRTTKHDDLAHVAECRVSSNANEKPTPSPCTRRNPTSGGRSERNCARRSVQRYDVIQLQIAGDTDLHHRSPDRVVH